MNTTLIQLLSPKIIMSKIGIYYSLYLIVIAALAMSQFSPLYCFGMLMVNSLMIYALVGSYCYGINARISVVNYFSELFNNPLQRPFKVMGKIFIFILLLVVLFWSFILLSLSTEKMTISSSTPTIEPLNILALFACQWVVATFSSLFTYKSPINKNFATATYGLDRIISPIKAYKHGIAIITLNCSLGALGYGVTVLQPVLSAALMATSSLFSVIYMTAYVIDDFGLGKHQYKNEDITDNNKHDIIAEA